MKIFQKPKDIIMETFFPKRCVGCGKYGQFICFNCAGEVELLKTSLCPECGKITKNCSFCDICKRKLKTSLNGLFIASNYDKGPTKEIIHHLKYSGFLELSEVLGEVLYQKIKDSDLISGAVVVPVPLFRKREYTRGFNQAELIARYVSKKLHLSGGLALERKINTKTQVGLSRKERIENVNEAIKCIDQEFIEGKTVLLVDDVTTTGATLNECAKVLKESGAKKVYGLVVAKRV